MEPTLFDPGLSSREDPTANLEEAVKLSVVVPVSERVDRLMLLHDELRSTLDSLGPSHEIIYVVDGPRPDTLEELRTLAERDQAVKVLLLNRWFGESTALAVGLDRARGETILTLPSYPQVDPSELTRLLAEFDRRDVDLVVARRHPRIDSWFNRLQSNVFHRVTGLLTGTAYSDVSCAVRVMNRAVAHEVELYGDLHRFFPLLAYQRGFRVEEVEVRQSKEDTKYRIHRPGLYLRRVLDILTLFFLFKFTKKPLRFFGLVGSTVFGAGAGVLVYLAVYRLLQFGPIANRPLLILGMLLIVLGLQLFSVGLLGEIVIFTHAGGVKDYHIRHIRRGTAARPGNRVL